MRTTGSCSSTTADRSEEGDLIGPASRRALLGCGIAYPVVYVVTNDVVAARRHRGYDRRDQAISELSALGAPSRTFLVAMLPVYTALMLGFGAGVWASAGDNRALRRTAVVLVISGVQGVAWLPFPMSSRDRLARGAGGRNDTGHLALSGLTGVTTAALLIVGSTAFGRRFRRYSFASLAVALGFGGATGTVSANLTKGLPTPRMGLYERIGIGAWLGWLAALAVTLLRAHGTPAPGPSR